MTRVPPQDTSAWPQAIAAVTLGAVPVVAFGRMFGGKPVTRRRVASASVACALFFAAACSAVGPGISGAARALPTPRPLRIEDRSAESQVLRPAQRLGPWPPATPGRFTRRRRMMGAKERGDGGR